MANNATDVLEINLSKLIFKRGFDYLTVMNIQREEHGKKGAFFVEEDGDWLAEMTYFRDGQRKMVIDHTEVDDSLKGKGVGKALVETAVEFARENNLLIKPVCPFAKKVLEADEDYEDVLTR